MQQFKRYASTLEERRGIIVKVEKNFSPVVVSFPFLVEITNKVHVKLAHIGREKLLEVVRRQFWHPALDKVAREICRSCSYCQFNKTTPQLTPPTTKIEADYPFNIVAVSYTNLRAHETRGNLVCRLLLEKKKKHEE